MNIVCKGTPRRRVLHGFHAIGDPKQNTEMRQSFNPACAGAVSSICEGESSRLKFAIKVRCICALERKATWLERAAFGVELIHVPFSAMLLDIKRITGQDLLVHTYIFGH